MRPGEPFLRGEPLRIDFLGFSSDTYRLQQRGWQIAEERMEYESGFRIAIRHPDTHMSGVSAPIRWRLGMRPDRMMGLTVEISLAIQFMISHHSGSPAFFPVDATPSYEVRGADDLFDMPYFRPIEDGKEIFLKKASVEEIMQIALDKQEPEQARIRAERQREEYRRGGQTKAKLIMVA